MSLAERSDPRFAEAHRELAPRLGVARRIGVTGPPGAGKSSLVEELLLRWRAAGKRLGVVAVDPSSPFSGGALLADRVRMSRLALDSGVFIRSMATRGMFGGLARATDDLADVLDAYGCDLVLLETVGVGQSEIDVARSTDLTVVVLHPGGGDTLQAMKAGLMEAADLYLVNKADLPGAERVAAELADMLDMRAEGATRPPVLLASATRGDGLDQAVATLDRLLAESEASGRLLARRSANAERRVRRLVDAHLTREAWGTAAGLDDALKRSLASDPAISPHALAEQLVRLYGAGRKESS